jgi:hypothetical protein
MEHNGLSVTGLEVLPVLRRTTRPPRWSAWKSCGAILHLHPYLEEQMFVIRTEHHSLRWVLNLSDAQGRFARWRLLLLEFDYEVQYHPGALHHGADMMSRLRSEDPAIAEPTDEIDTEVPCSALAHSPLVTGSEELHTPGERDPYLVHPDVLRYAKPRIRVLYTSASTWEPILSSMLIKTDSLESSSLPGSFNSPSLTSRIYHSPSPSSTMSRYLAVRKMSLAKWMRQT